MLLPMYLCKWERLTSPTMATNRPSSPCCTLQVTLIVSYGSYSQERTHILATDDNVELPLKTDRRVGKYIKSPLFPVPFLKENSIYK